MDKTLHTKFGTAKLRKDGYYVISAGSNQNKMLHRLIWEDFWSCEIPDGYVIHHRNHIKTDNCILNLQLMERMEHNKLHGSSEDTKLKISDAHIGKSLSEETKRKISESHNGLQAGKKHPNYRNDLDDKEIIHLYVDYGFSKNKIAKILYNYRDNN